MKRNHYLTKNILDSINDNVVDNINDNNNLSGKNFLMFIIKKIKFFNNKIH